MSTQFQKFQNTQSDLKKEGLAKVSPQISNQNIAIQQLDLKISGQQDKKQVNNIIYGILQYPSSQIAQLHRAANRLGTRDQQEQEKDPKKVQQNAKNAVYCPCCGYAKQQDQLKLCQKIDDITNLGLSTFLYFQSIKNLAFILIEMLLIYSIYAFATNIVASGNFSSCGTSVSYITCSANLDYLSISLGSKQLNQTDQNKTLYYIQCWIGIGMVVVWFITFAALKYYQRLKQIQVDIQTKSASDFTLVVENLPQNFTQTQFQLQLKKYEEKVNGLPHIFQNVKKPLVITKYNRGKPFYLNQNEYKDQQLQKLQEQYQQMRQKFAEWILQRQDSHTFASTKEQRQQAYKQLEQNLKAQQKKITELSQKLKSKMRQTSEEQTTVFFVSLDSNLAKNLVTSLNPTDRTSKFRNFITCKGNSQIFQIVRNGKVLDIKIQRAPQPEDIIWTNIGLSDYQKTKRKIITFTVTVILLGASFAAVYGLSKAQLSNANNRYLSILISLVISLINVVISQTIRILSVYQRDYTTIKYQTSLAIKSVLAQLINSILVPIFANYFIKSNLYDKNGLADDIFMLGLTNSFVTPILKYFDFYYFFTKFWMWFKNRPGSKIHLTQPQLNALFTGLQFQLGYQYIYIVNLYLFVCFFVSLQPIICLFALTGYLLMYWTQKWALFNRMRRPIPGNDLINTAMSQIIFLGPIVYSLGSLTWSNFFPDGTPKYALLPNLIALGISVFMFIFPINILFTCCLEQDKQKELKYQDTRIYLTSQYDRLNPATAQDGFKDYMKFIQKFGEKYKEQPKQDQQKIANFLMRNAPRGGGQMGPQISALGPGMGSLFGRPQSNPMMLTQSLIPGMMPSMMNPMMNPMMGPMMNPMSAPYMNAPVYGFQQAPMINPFQQIIQQRPTYQPSPQNTGFQQPPPSMNTNFIPQQPVQQPFGMNQQQPTGFGFQPQPQPVQSFGPPVYQPQGGFQQPPPGFQSGFNQPPQTFNPFNNNFRQ